TPAQAAQALQTFLASGAEPPPIAEADPKMKKYVTWLELDTGEIEKRKQAMALVPGVAAKPPSGTVPAAQPVNKQQARAAAAARKEERRNARRAASALNLHKRAAGNPARIAVEVGRAPPATR